MRYLIVLLASLMCLVTYADTQDLRRRTIHVRSVAPNDPRPQMKTYGVTREDFQVIETLIPSLDSLVPIRHTPRLRVRVGDRTTESVITGTTAAYIRGKEIEVLSGRFLTKSDFEKRNNVAVIDAGHAKALFAAKDPVGEVIQVSQEYFTVVGVIGSDQSVAARSAGEDRRASQSVAARPAGEDRKESQSPAIFIPYSTMRSRLGDKSITRKAGMFEMQQYELSEIEVVVPTRADVFKTAEIVKRILQQTHEEQDYEVQVKR